RMALRIVKERDGHAPRALARNAPVGPRLDRGFDAVLAPVGNPVDVIDGVECLLAEILMINLDEPLIHRAEDDRRLAAPTVWIAVSVIFPMYQHISVAQELKHSFVRLALAVLFENRFADQFLRHL